MISSGTRRQPVTLVAVGALALALLGFTVPGVSAPTSQSAQEPLLPIDPPVLGAETPRGVWWTEPADPLPRATNRVVDGDPSDWAGEPSWFAGTVIRSAGELIYTDHLFDAYGADDGTDASRRELLGAIEAIAPEAYRLEATVTANLPGQLGAPPPPLIGTPTQYGDLGYQSEADLVELRLASDPTQLWVLARTAQMSTPTSTALLLLVDRGSPGATVAVPFNAGIVSDRADVAVLLAGDRGWVADLATGVVTELPPGSVATNPSGFANAIEAAIPLHLLGGGRTFSVAAATGGFDAATDGLAETGLGANLANVAFRLDEPVREWFDERQALALGAGTIDPFFIDVDLTTLRGGRTDRFVPGPGYHERIFASTTPGLAQTASREGLYQHYGVYLPAPVIAGEPLPLQFWLHWRGGNAHSAGMLTPGIFRHLGEDRGTIVVSPRGRGTSTWYVSRGHADFLEVWDDVHDTFAIDPARVYVAGHSMGGYGSYLLSILHPDRFAAALPVAGPVTQGAWTGLDFPGCDDLRFDEYSPCFIEANDGRSRDQHTRRMLDNLRNVPLAMFYAAADELVPVTGAVRQHERLLELGYRHRFFLFPAHEHFTHPIFDEWAAGAAYLDSFTLDPNPDRVTYVRDVAFERAVNEVRAGGITFDWAFDRAYWMSGLEVADGASQARFDGRTLALGSPEPLVLPDVAGPLALNQVGPFVATGLQWIPDPLASAPTPVNGFTADLTGAAGVELDLDRMGIEFASPVSATLTTDHLLLLRLAGPWPTAPSVSAGGESLAAELVGGVISLTLQPGTHEIVITPQGGTS